SDCDRIAARVWRPPESPLKTRKPDAASERRLEEIRREADSKGRIESPGIRPAGSPLPEASADAGYYGLPLFKPPVWTWEVPAYFFVGGAAGAAAVLGVAARIRGADERLVRDARWIAAIGANLSTPLLIADLGRPGRFLNMLRVFKLQSPMSVGAWIVAVFGGASTATVLLRGRLSDAVSLVSALTGLGMATYTGVLLGATAIPVWAAHASRLPIHFCASALGSAVALLELRGHRDPALQRLGLVAATLETLMGIAIESRADPESEPLRHGDSGITIRIGGALSGPIPALLRLVGGKSRKMREVAAVSTLLGSLITRIAWVEAGKASSRL
ncbi:MAG: polysulfide reductase NrfD, partial [Thermoanaerobaculia bacterium]|nr:polysulfide reductase NrfD [Thermoanaerobaculia bacterium]